MITKCRIGLVSYLNACPLGHGLAEQAAVEVHRLPPSQLAERLDDGRSDVALVPVVDYLAREDRWEIAVPYGIASRGPVWTVRIFSPVPIEKIDRLVVDTDSHTSVNLSKVLVSRLAGHVPDLVPRKFATPPVQGITEPTLLIGDKAWQVKQAPFIYDLGELWQREFGLPFVYAVWAARRGELPVQIKALLTATAEANLPRADELGHLYGLEHGFTSTEAAEYFRRVIYYHIDSQELAGLAKFKECLAALADEAINR